MNAFIEGNARQTTNVVESFNNQLQRDVKTNRNCSLYYLIDKIITYFDNLTTELACGYKGYGDFKLLATAKGFEKFESALTVELATHVNDVIDAKCGVCVVVPSLTQSIEILCNTSTPEANTYRIDIQRIFKHGFINLLPCPVVPVAVVNDSKEKGASCYYTVKRSDSHVLFYIMQGTFS